MHLNVGTYKFLWRGIKRWMTLRAPQDPIIQLLGLNMKEEEVTVYQFYRIRRMTKNKRGGGPKDGTFQGTMPSHTSKCLGLCSIIRSASLQPLRRWTEVSALEWEEEGAVFPLLQLTSSLLLSLSLDKHLHVYAAILVNFCLFTMLLLWTRHDAWHSTT